MEEKNKREIREVPLAQIDPFPNHPFKVRDDNDMVNLVESIAQTGLLTPIVLRKTRHKRFEVVSGHRRLRAFELLGRDKIPAEITNLTKEEATLFMVDSNLQRSGILPSEKAFAYKMRMDAIKEYKWRMNAGRVPERDFDAFDKMIDQGVPLGPLEKGIKTRAIVADAVGESRTQIQRYIRLTELVPEIIDLVDNGKLGMRTAVELSYIDKDTQQEIFTNIELEDACPTHAQSIRMRKAFEAGELDDELIAQIMSEGKPNQKDKIVLKTERFKDLLPTGLSQSEKVEYIAAAMEHYARFLQCKARDYER